MICPTPGRMTTDDVGDFKTVENIMRRCPMPLGIEVSCLSPVRPSAPGSVWPGSVFLIFSKQNIVVALRAVVCYA
jgi:hypothetical protein